MSYDVRVMPCEGYLRIEATGTRSPEESAEFFGRVAKESASYEMYDILLVLSLKGRLSTFQIHDIVSDYHGFGFDSRHTIAVVDLNPKSRPDMRFAEDVGNVRGLKGASFDCEDDAVRWLLARRRGHSSLKESVSPRAD